MKTKKNYGKMCIRDRYEGLINDEPVFDKLDEDDQILEAGHRWYTDPLKEPGELLYTLQGEKAGINEFSFKILRTVLIDCRLKDQYRIKFADPQDPQTFDTPLDVYKRQGLMLALMQLSALSLWGMWCYQAGPFVSETAALLDRWRCV